MSEAADALRNLGESHRIYARAGRRRWGPRRRMTGAWPERVASYS